MAKQYTLVAAVLLGLAGPAVAEDVAPATDVVRAAVVRALPLIQKGMAGHRTQRTCFACHNQAVPLLAVTTARSRGLVVDDDEVARTRRFIADFLDKNRENYQKGKGQGGQVDTAGYALWALNVGGYQPDATTESVAEYLLLRDKDRDHWRVECTERQPSEDSPFTSSYLAIRGLQTFGTARQKAEIDDRLRTVRRWLTKTPAKDTEDRVFRVWALRRAGCNEEEVRAAARDVLKMQRPDGGWPQEEGMKSDAYASGTALVVLHEAAAMRPNDRVYRRGMQYLLATQLGDGTWHVASRSKPFQTYFESGFPHGKDQFISLAASSWATTALALSLSALND